MCEYFCTRLNRVHIRFSTMFDAILADESYMNKIKYLDILDHKGSFLNCDQSDENVPVDNVDGYQIYKVFKLLCAFSLMYLMAGSWIGWDVTFLQEIFFIASSLIIFIWWIFKGYLMKLISCKKSKKLQICIYCLVPWRILSRCCGILAAMYVPKMFRILVYGLYCKLFNVNLEEIQYPLNHYPTLVSFFTRNLKDNTRTITSSGCLVVPCDGTLVHCGPMFGKQIRQVKGLDYHMNTFLGYQPVLHHRRDPNVNSRLYQCVFYLAPGDYHRFHSPCDWEVLERSHFHGRLLSVSPIVTKWFPKLLATNERVVYTGKWKHGFFSYTAVGATNVGSISVHGDPTLTTNKMKRRNKDHIWFQQPLELHRGEEMGYFSMGSSVVLIFEAPENFHFVCYNNTCVKLGIQLGILKNPFNLTTFEKFDCVLCDKTIVQHDNLSICDSMEQEDRDE